MAHAERSLIYHPPAYGLQPDGSLVLLFRPEKVGLERPDPWAFSPPPLDHPDYARYETCHVLRTAVHERFRCYNPYSGMGHEDPEVEWWFTESCFYCVPRTEGARLWLMLNAPS